MLRQQSGAFGITPERVAAQFHGELGEYAVAGAGQGVAKIHLTVGVGAGDAVAFDVHTAAAGEGAVPQVRDMIHSGGGSDQLKDGTGGKGGGEEAVEIDALVTLVVVTDLRGIGGVKGRSGHHAQDITGLIVVNSHGALPSRQSLVGGAVELGVKGEIEPVPACGGAGEEVVADEMAVQSGFGRGGDVVVGVAHRV